MGSNIIDTIFGKKKGFQMKMGRYFEIKCEKCGWVKSVEMNSGKNIAKLFDPEKQTICPKCGELCEPGKIILYN